MGHSKYRCLAGLGFVDDTGTLGTWEVLDVALFTRGVGASTGIGNYYTMVWGSNFLQSWSPFLICALTQAMHGVLPWVSALERKMWNFVGWGGLILSDVGWISCSAIIACSSCPSLGRYFCCCYSLTNLSLLTLGIWLCLAGPCARVAHASILKLFFRSMSGVQCQRTLDLKNLHPPPIPRWTPPEQPCLTKRLEHPPNFLRGGRL